MERRDKSKLASALIALLILLVFCAWTGFHWGDAPENAAPATAEPKPAVVKTPLKHAPEPPPLLAATPKNLQLEQLDDGTWMALFPARTLKDPARFQSLEYLVVPEKGEKAYEGLAVLPPTGWKALKGALNAGYPIVELRWKNELGQTVRRNLLDLFPSASLSVEGNNGVLLNHEKNSNEAKNPNLPPDGTEILIAVHLHQNTSDAAWRLWE